MKTRRGSMANLEEPNKTRNTKTQQQPTKKKKKKDWSFYVIIISLIIIAIPSSFLGYHIIQARLQTGQPLFGNRFKGDLSHKILPENLEVLTTNTNANENVQSVSYTITAATLRANVLVKPEVDKNAYPALADSVYEIILAELPLETYFKQTDIEKMYDVEINLYNTLSPTDENPFIFYLLSKSSASDEVKKQFMSESSHPDFIQELIDDQTAVEDDDTDKDVASDS